MVVRSGQLHPGWKDHLPECAGKVVKNVIDCDEYPYFTSSEGGPAGGAKPQAHLKPLDAGANRSAGASLRWFYQACQLEDNDAYGVIPLPLELELPVGDVGATFWVCGRG
jgi:hypothetical protein